MAALTAVVARALKQPSVLGYLFAGLLVGPYLLPIPVFADHKRVEAMAEFGVVLVMFAVGLEFRVAKLKEVLPTSGLTALLQVAFLFRSEEHTSELQSQSNLVCRLLLEKKK